MHKISQRIIKENCKGVGLEKGFKILSPNNLRKILISDCAQIVGVQREDAQKTITCRQEGKCQREDSLKCKICDEYKSLLRKFNYIDHDDQLFLACKLLKENGSILRAEQQKIEHLLVDEYQDINYSQWELIRLLSVGNPDNLFVVGDDYQSIYGFRGGNPKYIRNFAVDYAPNGIIKTLKINYRCPPNIFKGAFIMVQKYNGGYDDLLEKITFHESLTQENIKYVCFDQENQEAYFIAKLINEIGPSYDTLILVPTAYYAAPIKLALRKRFIKFSCDFDIEDTDLYLIYLLLRWLKEPSDNFSFRILIDKIIKSVGKNQVKAKREKSLQQISNLWKEVGYRKTLYRRLKSIKDDRLLTKLFTVVNELQTSYSDKDAHKYIAETLEKLKLWQNMPNFSKEIISIVEEAQRLSMSSRDCSVRILTMNSAKGLEADYVFIVGVQNNILPRSDANQEKKKEGSRLFYVSMTRAKKILYILHSKVRNQYITKIKSGGSIVEKSEFIDAIPKRYIEEIEPYADED